MRQPLNNNNLQFLAEGHASYAAPRAAHPRDRLHSVTGRNLTRGDALKMSESVAMHTPPVNTLLDFSGRTVLVTGAGSGLGCDIARRFAEAGAAVVVSYRSSADGAREVAAGIEADGGRAVAVQADVTAEAEVDALIDRTVRAHGRLDVVINNAGIYPMVALTEMTAGDWRETVDANLTSVFLMTRAASRHMIDRGKGGAIVNIASIEGYHPAAAHSHYNTTKAGVLMHTRAAALELGSHDIRVNSVSPGVIWREGIEDAWPDGVERWHAAAPLGRLGTADDVADACLFLASPAARWITGSDLKVDGGVTASSIF